MLKMTYAEAHYMWQNRHRAEDETPFAWRLTLAEEAIIEHKPTSLDEVVTMLEVIANGGDDARMPGALDRIVDFLRILEARSPPPSRARAGRRRSQPEPAAASG